MYRLFLNEAMTSYLDVPAEVVGQDTETFPGEDYTVIQVGDFTGEDPTGVIFWFDLQTKDQIGFRAAEMYNGVLYKSAKATSAHWVARQEAEETLWLYFNQGVGNSASDTATATTWEWDGFTESELYTYDITFDLTVLSDDETVTVPYGTVTQAKHVYGDLDEIADDWQEYGTAEFYFHADLGLVSADVITGFWGVQLVSWGS
ncbi:MAG: hypothetical protein M5R36_18415 [Deltaproteobacteria bacterium]|nr:hypothetical protein [Deltaproteobacteria bacterium]